MKAFLARYPKEVVKKAVGIKALFFDVDGVLTDGRIVYDEAGKEIKQFNVKDGQIIGHLRKAGILIGAISGRESAAVSKRAAELQFDFCHQGIVDKEGVLVKLMDFHQLKKKEVAYIGDDINDLGILKRVGLPVCPADAPLYVREFAFYTTLAPGGYGVVREVADLILAAQGYLAKVVK